MSDALRSAPASASSLRAQSPRPAAHSRTRASGHRQDLIPIDEFC
eukprot:COSAG04_NODE_6365_length_1346_cov_1.201283_2_plen_44_part_01